MKRIVALFKKTHEKNEEPPYPAELEHTYKITKKTLGVGSFAVVKECIHRGTHQPYALKIILKKAIEGKHTIYLLVIITKFINRKGTYVE
jgi:calcium/calmodulin-dependent protein kinase I